MAALAQQTIDKIRAALEDDLNTAQAQAAIFEMVRQANAAADANQMKQEDVPLLLNALEKFDEIFAVLKDDDEPKIQRIIEWAKAEGKLENASKELVEAATGGRLSDIEVDQKIARMEQARKSRDFKSSDTIRGELASAGVIVESTKDGTRWRRK